MSPILIVDHRWLKQLKCIQDFCSIAFLPNVLHFQINKKKISYPCRFVCFKYHSMLSINALLWFIHSPSKFKLYYMYIYLVYHAWCSIELSHFNPNANEPLLQTMLKYNDCGPWFKTMEIYPEIAIKKKTFARIVHSIYIQEINCLLCAQTMVCI